MSTAQIGWVVENTWGSRKKTGGTPVEGEDVVLESYEIDFTGREDHNIFVIFYNNQKGEQTYECVLTPNALGRTAYITGEMLDNPAYNDRAKLKAAAFKGIENECGPHNGSQVLATLWAHAPLCGTPPLKQ